MTNAEVQALIDQAVAELKLTTVGFVNKRWTVPPAGSHWANSLGFLAQARAGLDTAPPPPPPPPPTPAQVLWAGDYETGDLSQWRYIQDTAHDPNLAGSHTSITVVSSPVRQGSHAARFVVSPGPSSHGSERAEVGSTPADAGSSEGQEWWYGWSMRFPAAGNTSGFWPTYANFNDFTQFISTSTTPFGMRFGINQTDGMPRIYFETTKGGGTQPVAVDIYELLGAVQFDHWYDFQLRVRWSVDRTVGLVELWMDGAQVVPSTPAQTLEPGGYGVYWKQGFYRAAWTGTNTVIHDGARRGNSRAAVQVS
jgi:hypothetical protein